MGVFEEIRSKARFGASMAALIGLAMLISGCDKCGDWVHFNAPSIPKNCTANDPPQK